MAVAIVIIVFGQKFKQVIAALAFFFVANYTLSFISIFVLRRREPDKQRPYRAWGYPWTTGLALIGSVLFLIGAIAADLAGGTRFSIYALVLLAFSYPLFRLMKLTNVASND
jgi:APA family basic amino acid/polyamine antiporter